MGDLPTAGQLPDGQDGNTLSICLGPSVPPPTLRHPSHLPGLLSSGRGPIHALPAEQSLRSWVGGATWGNLADAVERALGMESGDWGLNL